MKNNLLTSKDIEKILGIPLAKKLMPIISDKCGIINALLARQELFSENLHMFQSLTAHTKILFDLNREVSSGGLGVNEDKKEALLACIGESIERYCMSYFNSKYAKVSTYARLPPHLKPRSLPFYSATQYGAFEEFTNPVEGKIHWTLLQNWKDPQKKIFWPSSLIYLPFKFEKVAETTSTGTAAHASLDKAILSGLLENIERDALMINFYQKLNPPRIDLDTIQDSNRTRIQKLKRTYDLYIYKLYSDIRIPIYLIFLKGNYKNKLHFGIGACAALDSEKAIHKALTEGLFTYFYSKDLLDLKKERKEEIIALHEHFLYYQGPKFATLTGNNFARSYTRETCTFSDLQRNLKECNLEPYCVELTTQDIQNTSLRVVKVIVPGLIDLSKTYNLVRMNASRFWTVPRSLGLPVSRKLNSEPHPFP